MASFRTLDNADFTNKTVLLRADLNVPMKDGKVADDTRLVRLKPTIDDLRAAGAKIVILSHFGRPKGKPDPAFTLAPVAARLGAILDLPVRFASDCVGPVASEAIGTLLAGDLLVLENTRFHAEEEKNDPAFVQQIAALGDIFVNDAFSAAHRAHATTEGLAHALPAYAGRLMQEELVALSRALEAPERPLAAVVGGAKISTKLDLLNNMVAKVDYLILGGGMANTFMAASGQAVGASLYEPEMLETAREIMKKAAEGSCKIVLPTDVVVAAELKADAEAMVVPADSVPQDRMILDLGPDTIGAIVDVLTVCKTLVWNGPLGVFETPPFDKGTNELARAAAALTEGGKLLSVAGGGDTVAALAHACVADKVSYLSTAGGAFLEWLEGKELPGVVALAV